MKRIHNQRKSYKCESCDKAFITNPHLQRHLSEFCHKAFSMTSNMLKHCIAMHEEKKDHKCQFCDKNYLCIRDLANHISKYHKSEHVSCKVCGKEYKSEENLKLHVKTIHEVGTQESKCNQCKKVFTTNSVLNRDGFGPKFFGPWPLWAKPNTII